MLILTICGTLLHFNMKDISVPCPTQYNFKYAALTSSLQPNKRDLNVLVCSNVPGFSEEFKSNPLVKTVQSKKAASDMELNYLSAESAVLYDLIFIMLPTPESIAVSRVYSKKFWNDIKKAVVPEGCVAVYLPQNLTCSASPDSEEAVYRLTKNLLKDTFRSVKPAPGIQHLFLCGDQNITGLPSELDQRLDVLIKDEFRYPKGVFRLQTTEQEYAIQYYKHQSYEQNIFSSDSPCPVLQKIWLYEKFPYSFVKKYLEYQGYLFCVIFWICIFIYLVKRYLSAGNSKDKFCNFENGIFLGITLLLTVIGSKTYSNWYIFIAFLFGIIFGDFCKNMKNIQRYWSSILGFLALILLFLAKTDGIIYPAAALTGGFSFGKILSDDNNEKALSFYGISTGFIITSVLFFMKGGIISAIILAILTRIPSIVDKKIKNDLKN